MLAETAALGDRRNMTYMGTVVAGGKARAVVVATGMHTELGRIGTALRTIETERTAMWSIWAIRIRRL